MSSNGFVSVRINYTQVVYSRVGVDNINHLAASNTKNCYLSMIKIMLIIIIYKMLLLC